MALFAKFKEKKKIEKIQKKIDKRVEKLKKEYEKSPEKYMEKYNRAKPASEPVYPSKPEFNPVVLYWVSCKKKGYEVASNKAPQWFLKDYGIDFNAVLQQYIASGCISVTNGIATVTDKGYAELKEQDHIIFIHNHKDYGLTVKDYTSAKNFRKVQTTDIAWGVFNSRILKYTKKGMWHSLADNYSHMAKLLVEEGRYSQSLDYIFMTAYIETSGMKDNNELTPYDKEFVQGKYHMRYYANGNPYISMLEIYHYAVTAPFTTAQKNLNLTWDEIKERYMSSKLLDSVTKLLPFTYFEKEEAFEFFKEAVETGKDGGVFGLGNLSKELKYNKPDETSKSPYFYDSIENKFGLKLD